MNIKKSKKGTYDITGVSLGKLIAIVNAIDSLGASSSPTAFRPATAVQQDVRDIIKNNPDYIEDTK